MITAFALAFRQLGERALLAVLAKSLALTIAVFVSVGAVLYWLLGDLDLGGGWTALVVLLATLAAVWLAFRGVAVAVIGLFGDDVVRVVEARHYPPRWPAHDRSR